MKSDDTKFDTTVIWWLWDTMTLHWSYVEIKLSLFLGILIFLRLFSSLLVGISDSRGVPRYNLTFISLIPRQNHLISTYGIDGFVHTFFLPLWISPSIEADLNTVTVLPKLMLYLLWRFRANICNITNGYYPRSPPSPVRVYFFRSLVDWGFLVKTGLFELTLHLADWRYQKQG